MRPSASQVVTDVAMQHPNFIAAEDSDDDMTDVEDDLHLANVDVDKVSRIARNSDSLTTYNLDYGIFSKSFETYLSTDFGKKNVLNIHERLVHRVFYG